MGINEIEKMFGNAGFEREFEKPVECIKNPYITCEGCMLYDDKKGKCNNKKEYPPFTIKEQIELIKWLARHNFVVCKNLGGWYIGINPTYDEEFGITCSKRATNYDSFEYALASLINTLWQSLTEEEKEQIREILK